MIPYINIHTHHLSDDNGVFLFNNRFGFDTNYFLGNYFSIGIHPWDTDLKTQIKELEQFIKKSNCLAIGECGLDKLKGPTFELQKKVFLLQLDLAVKYKKPVIIHCVKAYNELIEICKPYHSKTPLIIHGFNKSSKLAKLLIDNGFYLSIHHSVFAKRDEFFSSIVIEKIFLETDNNANMSIIDVYKKASLCFQLSEILIKEKIYINFTTLFKEYGR